MLLLLLTCLRTTVLNAPLSPKLYIWWLAAESASESDLWTKKELLLKQVTSYLQVFSHTVPLLYSSVVSQQSKGARRRTINIYHLSSTVQSQTIPSQHVAMLTADPIIDAGRGDVYRTVSSIGTMEVAIGTCSSSWAERQDSCMLNKRGKRSWREESIN